MLAKRAGMTLQMVSPFAPLSGERSASEQAFEWFKQSARESIGSDSFGMVLVHHGRAVGDASCFDNAGLFLDKTPVSINVETTLNVLSEKSKYLHEQGISYVAMEYADGIARKRTLPVIKHEVICNFNSEIESDEVGRVMKAEDRMKNRLKVYQGLMFEAHQESGEIVAFFALSGAGNATLKL